LQSAPRRVERTPDADRPTSPGWIAVILFGLLAAIGVLAAVAMIGGYIVLSRGLINPQELAAANPPHEESIVYDRTGKVELARFGDVHREAVAYDQIPKILIDATTAVEDKTFWTNTGFDPAAVISAGFDALRGRSRGASTITQQLVRQRLLEPDLVQSPSRTLERKLKEIIQSIRLTQAYSGEQGKQDIITAYLNQNFYGDSSYGVKAAARSYFNKELKDLTVSEAAILAALPQSPSSYDLVRNAVEQEDGTLVVPPETEIVQRRNLVLDLLASGRTPLSGNEYTAADFEAAKQDPVVLAKQVETRWTAPHFVWAVRDELTQALCGEGTQTCPQIEQGGLRITTTLDANLQKIAEKWVKAAAIVPKAKDPKAAAKALGLSYDTWMQRLRDKDLNNGALVAIDYQTGELVAYVGSADYYAVKGNSQFQPKFDVVGDGYRQPGSAFKPFNYLTGIDDRTLTAATMFMDVATDFGGNYTPTDADHLERGPVRVRTALQFSLNIPSVKGMAVNHPEHVFARVQDFGMRFRPGAPTPGLALALGVQEVRPVDLVNAYATLANGGRYVAHTTILTAQDANGHDVISPHDAKAPGQQVASPEAAAIVTDMLAGNTDPAVNPFWGKFRVVDGGKRRPATLKTGTNNEAKDLNAYGFIAPPTADGRAAGEHALAVGIWNGNSDNTVVSPKKPLFSIDVSTYVWQGFLTEATKGWRINDFSLPDTLVTADVDAWTGLRPVAGGKTVKELFIRGTAPEKSAANAAGSCGQGVLEVAGFESRFDRWMAADRDWIARAQRGPGVVGGPDRTRTSYFYDSSFMPYGASWGPLLSGAGCGTPAPAPSCFVVPTADASGVVPSFQAPSPSGSGPAPQPCPPASVKPSASPSASPVLPSVSAPASVPEVTPSAVASVASVAPSIAPSAAAAAAPSGQVSGAPNAPVRSAAPS
jgi:membrane peptidoglycan carboxypeptidase